MSLATVQPRLALISQTLISTAAELTHLFMAFAVPAVMACLALVSLGVQMSLVCITYDSWACRDCPAVVGKMMEGLSSHSRYHMFTGGACLPESPLESRRLAFPLMCLL